MSIDEQVQKLIVALGRNVSREEYQENLRAAIAEMETALEASEDDDRRDNRRAGR